MDLFLAKFLFISCFVASSYEFKRQFNKNAELEWDKMAKMARRVAAGPMPKVFRSGLPSQTTNTEYRMLPDFLVVSSAKDQKSLFKPERGARQLPISVKDILFPSITTAPQELSARPKQVEILCHLDRIYVRVRRDIFKTLDAYKYLKLGTCPVNQGTPEHYYFLYYLTAGCGFKKENNVDDMTIKNVLQYLPTSAVLRDMPFDVPVLCKYPRLLHSYKVGIHPKLQGGTLFKSLKRKSAFALIPQDASGNLMTTPYVMGEPMFFEAKQPNGAAGSADDRMYINQCFMTSTQVPTSNSKYTIIDNFGCMIDGKQSSESRFLPGSLKTSQRFTLSAVILREMASSLTTKQLYMHCDITVGKNPPSEGFKACNYDPATKKWKELYGDHTVCICCDSSCSSVLQPRAHGNIVTSQPWTVDFKEDEDDDDDDDEDDLKMKTFDADFDFEDNAEEMTTDLWEQWKDN